MKVYVICNNDAIVAVALDKNKATEKIKKLSEDEYNKRSYYFATFEDYQSVYYWHLHIVECL